MTRRPARREHPRQTAAAEPAAEDSWFDAPDPTGRTRTGERGLRFECTSCGACCSGPPGYTGFTPDEGRAIARHLGIGEDEFIARYTKATSSGPSLAEKISAFGFDCVFLDRQRVPGKALCSIYEVRPEQCRTWPFWRSVLQSERTWDRAASGCPGMNRGPLHQPSFVRLTRDRVDI